MRLEIAVEGPCKGHGCDNCKTCRAGRCCRRDNPLYRLPEEGSWPGPIFGTLGVLASDGVRVQCHICGNWYLTVARHAVTAHDVTAREYKALFGFPLKKGLVSPYEHGKLSSASRPTLDRYRPSNGFADVTLEQRVAWVRRTRLHQSAYVPRFVAGVRPPVGRPFEQGDSGNRGRSRFMGVTYDMRTGRWKARIGYDGVRLYLGLFSDEVTAARAYDQKAREFYGDAARLNFPEAAP
jgi:AP2 domain